MKGVINQLKNGLTILFKKWIDDVKRAHRRIPEIKEQIAFYESQLGGYHAVTYDSVRVKTYGNAQERNLLFTIQKIDEHKAMLEREQLILKRYKSFLENLDETLSVVLALQVESHLSPREICQRANIKRARYYRINIRLNSELIDYLS